MHVEKPTVFLRFVEREMDGRKVKILQQEWLVRKNDWDNYDHEWRDVEMVVTNGG